MGAPMASNLLRAGYSLRVYDIDAARVQPLVGIGARAGSSAADVAAHSDVVITMLPNGPDVEAVVLGEDGVLSGAAAGTVLVDMSSIAPLVTQRVSRAVQEKGVRMLDAPVSGGEPKAREGTLAIMVGGPADIFARVEPLLQVMGATVTRVGDIGSGNTTKLANQIIVALNIAAISEAMTLVAKAGVDPQRVFEAIRAGLAGSTVLEAKMPLILKREFAPGFRIGLHVKDLNNALDTGESLGTPLELSSMVLGYMKALLADGRGGYDHGGLVTFFEKRAGVVVGAQPAAEVAQDSVQSIER